MRRRGPGSRQRCRSHSARAQTIGGAINLRTRRVPVNATIAEVDTAYGAFNTLKAHGFTGYGTQQWGVLGEVAHHTSDGFKELDGGGATGFLRQDAMVKGRWSSDLTEEIINASRKLSRS